MSLKKAAKVLIGLAIVLILAVGCSPAESQLGSDPGSNTPSTPEVQAPSGAISVVSREDGSGTRSAFIELFKVQVSEADGSKKDMTTDGAIIAPKTDVMMTSVSGSPNAIGYISLGSLNDTVKALDIDGAVASTSNVKNGSYKISRPFIIATKGAPAAGSLAEDFINYILSAEGQGIISNGYIPVVDSPAAYAGQKPSGKIVVEGSSSVTPIMEQLIESYKAINTGATIELQMSDSSAGLISAMEGTCDIGMSSRELKDTESAELSDITIAMDGIAVIVNKDNALSNLTSEQVRQVFTAEVTDWAALQ